MEKVVGLAGALLDQRTEQADLLFVGRYDAPHPSTEVFRRAREKFREVSYWRSTRDSDGFPNGCNGVAYGIFQFVIDQRRVNGVYGDVNALLMLESDCVILRRNWVTELVTEWEGAVACGKLVAGEVQPAGKFSQNSWAHVNAVALYDIEILRHLTCLVGGPREIGWDYFHGKAIVPVTHNSSLFKLDYQRATITEAELYRDSRVLIYHGVKDDSALQAVYRRQASTTSVPIKIEGTLVSVHGYAGDAHQIEALLPVMEHHGFPIVVVSPEDSPIEKMGGHICRYAGKRAYIGQDSWDRQHLQMKLLLEYPFAWYLLNDSDSFVLPPKLPDYLYAEEDVVWSNEVDDFRKPGETWTGEGGPVTWAADYHAGHPLIAMQPPYFMSRFALERMVKGGEGLVADPVTPFIDWYMVACAVKAGLRHKPFRSGASCETVTPNGEAVMSECIVKRGATFIHSVKSREVMERLRTLHQTLRSTTPC
jgi:hypothetical protein